MASLHMEEREHRGWFDRLHLSWPMLFVAGWLLYEFTAQPGLAALVACAKFGWADVRTAFWLRRVDPDRRRGETCFWSYLTYGLWKVAILATLSILGIGMLHDCFVHLRAPQAGHDSLLAVVMGAASAALLGFGLSFPTTYIAFWSAYRNGVRIWLGNAAVRARKERFWPPSHGQTNMAYFVCSTILLMTIMALEVTCVALIPFLLRFAAPEVVATTTMAASAASFFLPIILFGKGQALLARTPQDCWQAIEDEKAYQTTPAEGEGSEV